ncbi:hypothetical protein HanIR_Chr01g0035961 [Helianthus annuus]|nr:hypothetical protein HanIR_Chr01g0035961 [Helianthus annuus]
MYFTWAIMHHPLCPQATSQPIVTDRTQSQTRIRIRIHLLSCLNNRRHRSLVNGTQNPHLPSPNFPEKENTFPSFSSISSIKSPKFITNTIKPSITKPQFHFHSPNPQFYCQIRYRFKRILSNRIRIDRKDYSEIVSGYQIQDNCLLIENGVTGEILCVVDVYYVAAYVIRLLIDVMFSIEAVCL